MRNEQWPVGALHNWPLITFVWHGSGAHKDGQRDRLVVFWENIVQINFSSALRVGWWTDCWDNYCNYSKLTNCTELRADKYGQNKPGTNLEVTVMVKKKQLSLVFFFFFGSWSDVSRSFGVQAQLFGPVKTQIVQLSKSTDGFSLTFVLYRCPQSDICQMFVCGMCVYFYFSPT